MSYADKTLTCRDCGMDFVFTAGEQEFYAQKGFTNEPTRCPTCRQQRKAANSGRGGGMSSGYERRDSYLNSRSVGGGASYGANGNSAREMHVTVCASCGGEALVPFVPRGDKPVYCSNCFQQQRRPARRW